MSQVKVIYAFGKKINGSYFYAMGKSGADVYSMSLTPNFDEAVVFPEKEWATNSLQRGGWKHALGSDLKLLEVSVGVLITAEL